MSSTESRDDDEDDERARRALSALAFAPGAIPRSESVEKLTRARSVPSTSSLASPVKRVLSRDAVARARGAYEHDASKPRVLLLHCGGTLGMGTESFENDARRRDDALVPVAGGKYRPLGSSKYLLDVLEMVPEMMDLARVEVEVVMNKDSSAMCASDWTRVAEALHARRDEFSAFVVAHGTDTMAYTASALSMMLVGFNKPIVITGSQLPLAFARSDARQNLIDSLTVCCASTSCGGGVDFCEVAICFGGKLLRGNRAQKLSATVYAAFDSPSYPALAKLGVGVEWNYARLLPPAERYEPIFQLDPNVICVRVIPGMDPECSYGDLYGRGVRGIILEAFGVGNFPETLIPWLTEQKSKGLCIYLSTQCQHGGELRPDLYAAGLGALAIGAQSGPVMTTECAVAKMMLALANPERVKLTTPRAGESQNVDFCA